MKHPNLKSVFYTELKPSPGPNAKSISVLGRLKSMSYFITDSEI